MAASPQEDPLTTLEALEGHSAVSSAEGISRNTAATDGGTVSSADPPASALERGDSGEGTETSTAAESALEPEVDARGEIEGEGVVEGDSSGYDGDEAVESDGVRFACFGAFQSVVVSVPGG